MNHLGYHKAAAKSNKNVDPQQNGRGGFYHSEFRNLSAAKEKLMAHVASLNIRGIWTEIGGKYHKQCLDVYVKTVNL